MQSEAPNFGVFSTPPEKSVAQDRMVIFDLSGGAHLEISQQDAHHLSTLVEQFMGLGPTEQIPDFELAKRTFGEMSDENIAKIYGLVNIANLILLSKGLEIHDDEKDPDRAFYSLKEARRTKGNTKDLLLKGTITDIGNKISEAQGIPEEVLQKPFDLRELSILASNIKTKNGTNMHLSDGTEIKKFSISPEILSVCNSLIQELRDANMPTSLKNPDEIKKEALAKLAVIFEDEQRAQTFIEKHGENGKKLLEYLHKYSGFVLEVLGTNVESFTLHRSGQPVVSVSRRVVISQDGADAVQLAFPEQ